jgi:hypothetical protein
MRSVLLFVLFSLLVSCANQPTAEPLKIGAKVEFALLQDQFANPFPHDDKMAMLLYADAMQASRDVRDAMARIDPACYEQGKLVFVANVSGMPRMITKLIAVPKMRGYGFPVWLDYSGEATVSLPVKEDQVSIVSVDHGVITRVDYAQGLESILNAVIPLCGVRAEQVAQR